MKFNHLVDQIDAEYRQRGDKLGWRWLYSPRNTLTRARVALVGLNPSGGSHKPPIASCDDGNAYANESWGGLPPGHAKLQRQVLSLFSCLDVPPDEVLTGNLVPFRSRSWEALAKRPSAVTFGQKLWRQAFSEHTPELIITMGNTARDALVEVLDARDRKYVTVNWGGLVGTHWALPGGGRLVGLPHLDRFDIVTRTASQPALEGLLGKRYDRKKTLAPSSVRIDWLQKDSDDDLLMAVPEPEG